MIKFEWLKHPDMKHCAIILLSVVFMAVSCSKSGFVNNVIPAPQICQAGPAHHQINLENVHVLICNDEDLPESEEGYVLQVGKDGDISLRSRGEAGIFYGKQTLARLVKDNGGKLPELYVKDWPRYEYRGLHMDVSRHFFDKDVVKKQLRLWAELKINRFHWHLTDSQAWRLQIDAYPLLTEGIPHYTKDDVREVLALADSLHITVIPEIEMFGHSGEVLHAYPELACEGRENSSNELCVGKEETFRFLETVLDEVMNLFPSEFIHIGGDEANMSIWDSCPDCHRRMEAEDISEVEGLQSYGIERISDFLTSRGRRLLGWDEIMKGGLAPDAAVMSWTGEESGRQAATMGHDVIMTPIAYCYINNAQDNPSLEPVAQGGYVSLRTLYDYNPSHNLADSSYVKGVQANLWTEYVETPEHLEYMYYPRAFALAEIGWDYPADKDYASFREKALLMVDEIRSRGYNTFNLAAEVGGRPESKVPLKHKALGCPVTYDTPYYAPKYDGGGDGCLTDGRRGSWDYINGWQGFLNSDIVATVDLGKVCRIKYAGGDFGQWTTDMVWMPVEVSFEGSVDGIDYYPLCTVENDVDPHDKRPCFKEYGASVKARARYVRMTARIHEGGDGWLFADEIIIR